MTSSRLPAAGLEGRLKSLSLFRGLMAGAGLASLVLLERGARDPSLLSNPFFYLFTTAIVFNFAYLLCLRLVIDQRRLFLTQLVIDVIVISGLVYLAGPDRAYSYAYFAVVFAGSALGTMRTGMVLATLSAVLLGAISGGYYASLKWELQLPYATGIPQEVLGNFTPALLVLFLVSLYALAWLAGKLAEEISRVRILNEEILSNMAGGVIAIDRLGVIAYLNPQAVSMLGIRESTNRLVGADSARVLPAQMHGLFKRVLTSGDSVEQEIQVGATPIEVSISHLTDGRKGGLRGAVAILNDLTLRSQMEQMEQRAERFKALLEMSAGIAHEIRNPLASIRGAVQELETAPLSREDDKTLLRVIIRESDRLNRIITDFLEYATERPMEFSLVNLADLLREVAVLLEAREEGRAKIKLEVPRQIVCRGSPDKLKQVFLNLGLNAIEACGEAGLITIRCVPAQDFKGMHREGVLVEFEDNGPGIPKDDIEKLFTPFFTTKPKGTGMGLAIARKIIQGHDGQITIESQEKKGAVARIWLPSS